MLIPVFMVVFGSADFMEWMIELPERMSTEQIVGWLFGIGIAFDVLLIVLFGWLSWHRLKKMPY